MKNQSLSENYIDVDSNYEYAKAYVQAATIFNKYNAISNGYVNNDIDAIISVVENSTIDYDNLQDFSEDILDELAYMMVATKEEAIEGIRKLWNDANNNDTIEYNPQIGNNIVLFAILLLISIIGIAVTGKVKQ